MRFSQYHPAVLFTYFSALFILVIFAMNPVISGISLIGMLCFLTLLRGINTLWRTLFFYLLFLAVITISNPLFVQKGATVLFSVGRIGFSLEALAYGFSAGLMLISVMCCFSCYNAVFTSDKFMFLFAKVLPVFSLMISMTLRFIPILKQKEKEISQTQRVFGFYSGGRKLDKIKKRSKIFLSVCAWGLENAVITSEAMKARGYGLRGRTSFSVFSFRIRDAVMLVFIALLFAFIITSISVGSGVFEYYPSLLIPEGSSYIYACAAVMAFIPFFVEAGESLKWKLLLSRV